MDDQARRKDRDRRILAAILQSGTLIWIVVLAAVVVRFGS